MAAFTYQALNELPDRNVYDQAVREFSESSDKVWRTDFTDTSRKADATGLRRAVDKAEYQNEIRVITLKGELYLERTT